jgi:PAS domain S-box-containing protein
MNNTGHTNEQLLREIEALRKRIGELENYKSKHQTLIKGEKQKEEDKKLQSLCSRFMLDMSIDSYIVIDTKGSIVDINQAYCDLVGYSKKELLDMNIRQLIANIPSEEVDRRVQNILSTGRVRFETMHRHKSGKLLDLEASTGVLYFDGTPRIAAFMRDITDRKQALEALRDSEYFLGESQKVAKLGSYTLDFSSGIWNSSNILEEIFGIDKEFRRDVPGWLQIVHPDDRAFMQKYFETLVADKEKFFNKEYRILRIDDQRERWVHGLGELEYQDDGVPVEMIGTIQDITERKKVEQDLQESELRFRTIIEQAADALFIIDLEGKIIEVNNRACENLGYTRDELLSMNIGEIDLDYYENTRDPGNAIMSELQVGESLQIEMIHRRKDGTTFPAEASLGIIEINMRKVILGFVRDITKRKQAEEGLLKMSKAINNSSDVVFLTDKEGIITYVNPEFTLMYGFTAEEVVGKVTPRIIKSGLADNKVAKNLWDTLLSKQSVPASQYVNKRKNGKFIDVEGSADPIIDENGNILGFLGIQRDITKRIRAEKIQSVLFHISNAANTSDNLNNLIGFIQEELEEVIDTTNFYVALYDEETNILSFPSFVDDKDEVKSIHSGNTLSNYIIKTQKPLLLNKAEIKKLVKSGAIDDYEKDVKQWLGVPLKLKGKVTGVLAVQSYADESAFTEADMKMLEFVSDQISLSIYNKKAEQDLIIALEKATESDRLKSAFLASMSHELRTPLNAIIGFSDIFNRDLSLEEMMNYAKTINASGNQLLSIVEDLFDITLIEAGEIKIRKRKERLNSIMRYILEIIEVERQKTRKEHLELKLIIPPAEGDLIIHMDTVKLKQILINLLKNALKFTMNGHVHFGYKVEKDQNQTVIKFYVADTGQGIPEDKRELIFDVFRQLEDSNTRAAGGTGIGLSIAKKMTELLGGKIWVESVEGEGSVFYFTIPFEEHSIDGRVKETEIEGFKAKKSQVKKNKVLIVEDDEPSLNFLKILLEKYRIHSIWAKSGQEAINYCKDNSDIDLVLMDISMSEMDGYETTREIKSLKPELPIIAQTANAVEGDMEKVIEAGCDDYISKPIKKDVLRAKIEKYLGKIR